MKMPKLKPKVSQACPVLQIWRSMPPLTKLKPGIPIMHNMRGDPRSDICIIAPAPNDYDYLQGTPLSSPAALILHELFLEELDLSTQKCCVMSCSRYGMKANKANTEDIRLAFMKMVQLNQFKVILTIGDDAFKFFFGRGKKPAPSIFGNIMYVAEAGHKPLFAFPELDGLHVIESLDPRARRRLLDWQDKVQTRFRELLQTVAPVLRKYI